MFKVFAPVSSPSAKVTATCVPVLSTTAILAISSEFKLCVISKLPSAVKSAFTKVPEKYCKQLAWTGGVEITEKSVIQNVDLSLAQNIFAILDAALNKNYQEATDRLNNQLREGATPIQLLAVFENQLELILVVKILAQRQRSESQIVKELGVHPYRVKLAMKNKLAINKLEKLLDDAIKLEFNYKNGNYHEDNFLKLFVLYF